jgi:hypothetical protein
MRSWSSIFGMVALAIWMSGTVSPTRAQVADTIVVTIQGDLDQVILTWEDFDVVRIGDTIHFRAVALDSEGDPVSAVFRWASEDSTTLRIEELPDGRARGIAMKKTPPETGGVRVWVMVEPFTELTTALLLSDGSLQWERPFLATSLGQKLQLCSYLHRSGELVAEAPGPPVCPTVFLAPATPTMWPNAVVQRSVPWSWLMAMAGR